MAIVADAAQPADYYKSCEGKSGEALLKQLNSVVGSHTNVGYDGLWNVYKTSDVDANGKIWDMYSTKRWNTGEKCGNYAKVGDCYNREHSMPKSWFSEGSPMKSDAFHVYPTDGKVNGQRSNFPFGECANGTTLSAPSGIKALGRLGTSTFPGYSGKVFEPDDEYKGDFARTYFYMAAAYNDKISGWNSDMLAHNSFPVYKQWAIDLLLKWHRQDPVSKKETDRNDAVYNHQRNRNPFIDHPELAEHIWGNKSAEKWYANGTRSARLGKTATSQLTTASPKKGGIGTVSLDLSRWSEKDGDMTIAIEYSADGSNWTNAGSVTAKSDNFTTYSVPVKAEGNLYLRLRQTAGARGNIDNIAVTDYMKSGIDNIEYEDSWDAYCDADSRLVINNMGDSARRFTVYDIKGMVLFNGMVPSGTFTLSLTPGIYLVGSDVMVRRLVVY